MLADFSAMNAQPHAAHLSPLDLARHLSEMPIAEDEA
jgi:hypothetical protein